MQRKYVGRDESGGERGATGARVEPALSTDANGVDGSSTALLPPELARLLVTAQKEITEHGNNHRLCPVCGSAFPCERAVLADLTLSAFVRSPS